jgi:hypothetical protein
MPNAAVAKRAKRKAYFNIVLPLFIISVIAYIDRVNIGYAALTMNKDLGLTDQMFGMGVGAFIKDPWVAFFFLILAGIGVYAPFGVWWSYPTTFLTGTAAAGAMGLINSCGNIGGFVGPYLTGWIKEATGSFEGAWVYLVISQTLAGLLILTFKKNLPADGAELSLREVSQSIIPTAWNSRTDRGLIRQWIFLSCC